MNSQIASVKLSSSDSQSLEATGSDHISKNHVDDDESDQIQEIKEESFFEAKVMLEKGPKTLFGDAAEIDQDYIPCPPYSIRDFSMMCKLNKKFGASNSNSVRLCFVHGHVKNDVFVSNFHRLDIGSRNGGNDLFSKDIYYKNTF